MSDDLFSLSAPPAPAEFPSGTMFGFYLRWQDWRHRHPDDEPPEIHTEHFSSYAEADARKRVIRDADGIVACIVPALPPRAQPQQQKIKHPRLKGGWEW
jgi:hypothetical protein